MHVGDAINLRATLSCRRGKLQEVGESWSSCHVATLANSRRTMLQFDLGFSFKSAVYSTLFDENIVRLSWASFGSVYLPSFLTPEVYLLAQYKFL